MRTVLVTGGTGNLGQHVIRQLRTANAGVRLASRRAAPGNQAAGYEWATVDYRTRAGLDAALTGAEAVIHCASGSARGEAETMAALLSSGKRAGLGHLVYISIVGVDKLPMSYYRAKLRAERALIASGIPWTILRTTQFHDLALTRVKSMCKLPLAVTPRGVSVQPVAVQEVAARLVALALAPPAGRVPELGGPQIKPLAELARMYLVSANSRKPIVTVPLPGKLMKGLRRGDGLTPDHGDGVETFGDFLQVRAHTS